MFHQNLQLLSVSIAGRVRSIGPILGLSWMFQKTIKRRKLRAKRIATDDGQDNESVAWLGPFGRGIFQVYCKVRWTRLGLCSVRGLLRVINEITTLQELNGGRGSSPPNVTTCLDKYAYIRESGIETPMSQGIILKRDSPNRSGK